MKSLSSSFHNNQKKEINSDIEIVQNNFKNISSQKSKFSSLNTSKKLKGMPPLPQHKKQSSCKIMFLNDLNGTDSNNDPLDLGTQTPQHWQANVEFDEYTKQEQQQVIQTCKEKRSQLVNKYQEEQKQLRQALLDFGKKEKNQYQQIKTDLVNLQQSQREQNLNQIQNILENTIQSKINQVQENVDEETEICLYSQDSLPQIQPQISTKQFTPQKSKYKFKQVDTLKYRSPQQTRINKFQEQNSLLNSIKKEQMINFVKDKKRSISQKKVSQQENQWIFIQSQNIQSQSSLPVQPVIRDMNYINIFIQPHHDELSKINKKQEDNDDDQDLLKRLINILKESPLSEIMNELQRKEFDLANQIQNNEKNKKENLFEQEQIVINNKRIHVKLLNIILEQILSGKFYYKSEKMYNKMEKQDIKIGKCSKYLKGIDFKNMLFQSKNQNNEIQNIDMLPIDENIMNDIFNIDNIQKYEKLIFHVLKNYDNIDESGVATFLTQEYQPFDSNYQIQNQEQSSKTLKTLTKMSKEQKDKQDICKDGLNKQQKQHKKIIQNIMTQLNESNMKIQKYLTQSQYHSIEGQQEKYQMLYLCFLEMVRQIGTKCKEQALLLIKIWHCYFDQMEHQIAHILNTLKTETLSLNKNMESLSNNIYQFLENKAQKDLNFYHIKTNYEKTQKVLDIAIKLLHQEEEKTKIEQEQYRKQMSNILILYPNINHYMNNEEIQQRVLQSQEEKFSQLQSFYVKSNEYFDKNDGYVISDIQRMLKNLQTKSPSLIEYEKIQKTCLQLSQDLEQERQANQTLHNDLNQLQQQIENLKFQHRQSATQKQNEIEKYKQKYKNNKNELEEVIAQIAKTSSNIGIQTDFVKMDKMKKKTKHNLQKKVDRSKEIEIEVEILKQEQPIKEIIKNIRISHYKSQYLSVKKVFLILSEIVKATVANNDLKIDKNPRLNIPQLFYQFMKTKNGVLSLTKKQCELFLSSLEKYKYEDSRIELFRRFIGLDKSKLPYHIYQQFIYLLQTTQIDIFSFFTKNLKVVYVDILQVDTTLQTLIQDPQSTLIPQVIQQMIKFAEIFLNNNRVLHCIDYNDYLCMRDIQEKVLKTGFFNPLFQKSKNVSTQQFKDFMMKTCNYNEQQLESIIKIFFQEEQLNKNSLIQKLKQKLEIKLPFNQYLFHCLNSCIENENNENLLYERIYQFYTFLEVNPNKNQQGFFIKNISTLEGMDIHQFIEFLKDAEVKINEQEIKEIYISTCEQHNKNKLTCNTFIEACKKYKLINISTLNKLMQKLQNVRIQSLKQLKFNSKLSTNTRNQTSFKRNQSIVSNSSGVQTTSNKESVLKVSLLSNNEKKANQSLNKTRIVHQNTSIKPQNSSIKEEDEQYDLSNASESEQTENVMKITNRYSNSTSNVLKDSFIDETEQIEILDSLLRAQDNKKIIQKYIFESRVFKKIYQATQINKLDDQFKEKYINIEINKGEEQKGEDIQIITEGYSPFRNQQSNSSIRRKNSGDTDSTFEFILQKTDYSPASNIKRDQKETLPIVIEENKDNTLQIKSKRKISVATFKQQQKQNDLLDYNFSSNL